MKYKKSLFIILAFFNGLIMGSFSFPFFFMPYAILQFSSSPPAKIVNDILTTFSLGMTGIFVLVGGGFGLYMANFLIKKEQLKHGHYILVNLPLLILIALFLRASSIKYLNNDNLVIVEQRTEEDQVVVDSFQVNSINSEKLVLLSDFTIDNISNTKYVAEVKFVDSAYNTTFFKEQRELTSGMTVVEFDIGVQELLKVFFAQPQMSKFDGSYLPIQYIDVHLDIYASSSGNNRFQRPKASAQLKINKNEIDPFITR